ncbi:MAG: hypothetical protein ACFFBP_04800 [Promethearchaeota archaeon]
MAIPPTILGISIYSYVIAIQFLIGFIILLRSIKPIKISSLFLAIFNFTAGIAFIMSAMIVYTDNPIWYMNFIIFTYLENLFLSIFTQNTFYKEKKSPFLIILIILTMTLIIMIIVLLNNPNPYIMAFNSRLILSILFSIQYLIIGIWYGYISLKQYYKYKKVAIRPWIKMRYLLGGIAALAFGMIGPSIFIYTIATIDSFNPNHLLLLISLITSVILMNIFSIGSLITWVMPKRLKKLFERKFIQIKYEDLSEEEIEKEFLNNM